MKNWNIIIKSTFNTACDLGKFRTFASIYRSSICLTFDAKSNKEVFNGMSFQEWASYAIGDGDFGYYPIEELEKFESLAKTKGIYSIDNY